MKQHWNAWWLSWKQDPVSAQNPVSSPSCHLGFPLTSNSASWDQKQQKFISWVLLFRTVLQNYLGKLSLLLLSQNLHSKPSPSSFSKMRRTLFALFFIFLCRFHTFFLLLFFESVNKHAADDPLVCPPALNGMSLNTKPNHTKHNPLLHTAFEVKIWWQS